MTDSPRPTLLGLHTTEPAGSVALGWRGGCASRALPAGAAQSPALLEAILELLSAAGRSLGEIEGIAVTTGPGSFTGIRVGLATVQGLAAARAWMVHTCGSLRASAAAWYGRASPLAVVLDAKRGEVYAALYDLRGWPPQVLLEPFCAAPKEAAARLAAVGRLGAAAGPAGGAGEIVPPSLALSGSGAGLVAGELSGATILAEPPRPVAAALLDLAWGGHCSLVEPRALEPAYLRKSDAEVRRESTAPLHP